MIMHSVFFYLKENSIPSGTVADMETDIRNKLAQIQSVKQIWAGPPQGIDRDVVDNDYHTSLHAIFDDLNGLQAYQSDPVHVTFVETYKPWFQRIRVYDTNLS